MRGIHPEIKSVMKAALKTIVENPHSGKILKDELKGLRSYRVIERQKQLEIVAIGPRKYIYEETFRLIRKKHVT